MPSFNLLQNASSQAVLVFYVFDLLMLNGKDVMREPLQERRKLLETVVLPELSEPIRYSAQLNAPLKGSRRTSQEVRV